MPLMALPVEAVVPPPQKSLVPSWRAVRKLLALKRAVSLKSEYSPKRPRTPALRGAVVELAAVRLPAKPRLTLKAEKTRRWPSALRCKLVVFKPELVASLL